MTKNIPGIPIVDNGSAKEVFVSEAVGLVHNLGNYHLTFAGLIADHSNQEAPMARLVNLRIVIPVEAAHYMADELIGHAKAQQVLAKAKGG
jgi:hypothetical protein